MENWKLRPEKIYKTKTYLVITLIMLLIVGFSLTLGILIARDEGGSVAKVATWILGVNALWYIPTMIWGGPYCNSLQYEIEADEIIVKGGVVTKSVKHVPFRTVTNIEIKRDPLDRLFGLGSVKIQTAGMSGSSEPEENLAGLANYDEVYERVAASLRSFRGAMSPDQAGVMTAPATDDAVLTEILKELKGIRAKLSDK